MPPTRAASRDGDNSNRSPTETTPEATVPVTTRPAPAGEKLRSTASRNPPDESRARCAAALASMLASTEEMPSPVIPEASSTGAAAKPAPSSASRTAWCASRRRAASTRSILLRTAVTSVMPVSRRIDRCSRGLRHRPVISGDHQQHGIDRQYAGEHVRQKSFVAGNVDEADQSTGRQPDMGKAQIDRHAALFFFRQTVRVDPGQRADQRIALP